MFWSTTWTACTVHSADHVLQTRLLKSTATIRWLRSEISLLFYRRTADEVNKIYDYFCFIFVSCTITTPLSNCIFFFSQYLSLSLSFFWLPIIAANPCSCMMGKAWNRNYVWIIIIFASKIHVRNAFTSSCVRTYPRARLCYWHTKHRFRLKARAHLHGTEKCENDWWCSNTGHASSFFPGLRKLEWRFSSYFYSLMLRFHEIFQ